MSGPLRRLVKVDEAVRVLIVDEGRGTITYTLQLKAFGKWRDVTRNPVAIFYNVPPVTESPPKPRRS